MLCKVVHTFFLSRWIYFHLVMFSNGKYVFIPLVRLFEPNFFKPLTFLEHFPFAQLLTARWNISNNITVSVPT